MTKGLLAIAAFAALFMLFLPEADPALELAPVPGDSDRISAQLVSEWMIGGKQHFHLLDVRPVDRFLEDGLRGAISVPTDSLDRDLIESLPPAHLLIVYGERDIDATDAYRLIRGSREEVLLLDGGVAAWKDQILEPKPPAADASESAFSAYQERLAVANYLTGKSDAAPAVQRRVVTPLVRPRNQPKNEGC